MNRVFKSDNFKIVFVLCVAIGLAAGISLWVSTLGGDGPGTEVRGPGGPVFRMYTDKQMEQARKKQSGFVAVRIITPPGCAAARQWSSRMGPSPGTIEKAIFKQVRGEADNPSISTPLMGAVALENLSEVQRLIEEGADVNEANEESCTALLWAAMRGNKTILDALLDAGAEVDKSDAAGTTALIIASHTNSVPVVQALVEAGADVNARMVGGSLPEQKGDAGRTALMKAANNHRQSVVEYLLSVGADVNQADDFGRTALIHVSEHGPLPIVRALVDAGASVNAVQPGAANGTALMRAATFNQPEVVQYLLEAGADINHTDAYGRTALIGASQSSPANVRILVEAGADINAAQTQNGGGGRAGDTALMNAVIYRQIETIKFLLSNGADPQIKNLQGKNAYQIALDKKNPEAAAILRFH